MLSLGGGDVGTHALTRWMVFTAVAPVEMELIMKQERITTSVVKRRDTDMDLGG